MKRVGVLACGMLIASVALGAETEFWTSSRATDYARAEARGVTVQSDGRLTLGPDVSEQKSDSATIYWAAAVLPDGSVALGGAPRGRVDRWTAARGIQPWVRLGAGQVLCLARDGDELLAGTGPDGAIYRIRSNGDTALVARTGERYVWGLARAAQGWFAATGTRGRLLMIEGGRARVLHDSEESNLVSLVSDGRGGVYAGGDSQGRIFHAGAAGSVSTVFDASENEIRALAVGGDGALYAAALSAPAAPEEGSDDEPRPVKSGTGRSVVYRIVPDSVVAQHWVVPQPFVFAMAVTGGEGGGLLVATGNRAGLYRVDRAGQGALVFAPGAGQLTSIAVDARGQAWVAASNPGTLYRVSAEPAARGTLTSGTLDARRYARFGAPRWEGDARGGAVRLRLRSGNSDPADSTWSPWRAVEGHGGAGSAAPVARYLQWQIELERGSGAGPRVSSVQVAYREQNLAPRIDELSVAPQANGFREGESTPRSEPVTQTLPGGQKVEFQLRSADPQALRALPLWLRGLRVVSWRATDPNGDPLQYRLEYRREGDDDWREIAKELDALSYVWDTNGLSDGRYRLRVTASDEQAVAADEALRSAEESAPFTVDNTAPEVVELQAAPGRGSVQLSGRARDSGSILVRLELSVDGKEWRPLSPEGGLADDAELRFRASLRDLETGSHSISVRAVDAAGNTGTRSTPVRVTGR